MEDACAYGWNIMSGSFSWPDFRARLDAELDRLEAVYRKGLTGAGVTIHDCRAVIEDAHTVRLDDGAAVTAKHILIATGGRPFLPEAAQRAGALTSNDIFKFEALPKSVLIVGGGFIACEFACILNGMGVAVTQFYRGEQILRGFDGEARGHIAEHMREAGIDLHVGCDVIETEAAEGGIIGLVREGDRIRIDASVS